LVNFKNACNVVGNKKTIGTTRRVIAHKQKLGCARSKILQIPMDMWVHKENISNFESPPSCPSLAIHHPLFLSLTHKGLPTS